MLKALIGIFIILGTLYASPMQRTTVILDANEAPPFFSKSMPYNGMCGEIIHEISKACDIQTEIRFKPLSRMIQDDSNNELGNPAFFMNNQDFGSIIPIAIYHMAFYHYVPEHDYSDHHIVSLSDIRDSRIGIIKGSLLEPLFFQSKGIHFETSYSQESLFKKLKLQRLDYVIAVELVGNHIISKLFESHEEDFLSFRIKENVNPIAIMLSTEQDNVDMITEKYKKGLRDIIDNGTYDKILRKYYPEKHTQYNQWFKDLEKFGRLYGTEDEQ